MKRALGLIVAGMLATLALVLLAALPAQASDDPSEQKYYGIVNSRPTGDDIGTWVIGGRAFVANASTKFKTSEHGPLVVGACAKVEYYTVGSADVAKEIESESPSKCGLAGTPSPSPSVTPSPSATPVKQTHRGLVESRPVGLLGEWTIGGQVFVADNNTKFDFDDGPLTVGACAKVEYYVIGGVKMAHEIESKHLHECSNSSPSPSPTSTPNPREESKVFARIDAFPPAPYIGLWRIGGVEYQANSRTKFEQEDGPFAVGACVKAEFIPMNGVNTLKEVETEDDYKCQGTTGEPVNTFKAYGVIDSFTTTVPSTWVISSISYTVNASTKLEAEHGPFRVGAFVEVKYVLVNGERVATKIETHVAPGSGSNNALGTLDARPSDDWGVWVISGVSYQGDPAIRVELPPAALSATSAGASSQKVFINSYVANGVNMLTLIRAMPNGVYIPAVAR